MVELPGCFCQADRWVARENCKIYIELSSPNQRPAKRMRFHPFVRFSLSAYLVMA